MRVLVRILIGILVLCIPIVSILAAANLITRAPDLYSFEFTRSQVLTENKIRIDEKELSEYISDFMLGKEDEFDYKLETQDGEKAIFNEDEASFMKQVRYVLNQTATVLLVISVLILIGILVLFRYDIKHLVRFAYKLSVGLFIVFWFIIAWLLSSSAIGSWYNRVFTEEILGTDSLLLLMFNHAFVRDWLIALLGISIITMIVIGLILWRLTKPRRMFG